MYVCNETLFYGLTYILIWWLKLSSISHMSLACQRIGA